MQEKSLPIRLFDPHDEYFVVERRDLPHWTQSGAIVFITWRTWDSLPEPVLKRWVQDRERWLRTHHIEPENDDWRQRVRDLPIAAQVEDFDHLVRSEDQFLHYRQYIADNPRRADLRAGEFVHYTNPAATRGASDSR
ncbi:MAG TPA: hypothetical protein VMP01_07225 [Pirellulaceae bacterium]|nr:hypothetical protein [Pirellulaceae bacterium]